LQLWNQTALQACMFVLTPNVSLFARYGQSARLPDYVKHKLSELPSIVEMLVKAARETS